MGTAATEYALSSRITPPTGQTETVLHTLRNEMLHRLSPGPLTRSARGVVTLQVDEEAPLADDGVRGKVTGQGAGQRGA